MNIEIKQEFMRVRISMPDYIEQDYLTNIPLYAICNI